MLRFIGGFNQTQSRKHLHRPDRCIYPLSVGGVRNRVYLRILHRAPRLLQVLEHLTESHFVQKFCFLGPSQNTAGQRCGNEIDELFTPHGECILHMSGAQTKVIFIAVKNELKQPTVIVAAPDNFRLHVLIRFKHDRAETRQLLVVFVLLVLRCSGLVYECIFLGM